MLIYYKVQRSPSASLGRSFLICQIGEWMRWWMPRFLQFHEYEMIIAIVFLHYSDLQNRQLPPGMWFLHFGREMAEGKNQELGLHASPTDRHVHPGTGKGRRTRERNATLWGESSSSGSMRFGLKVGLCRHLAFRSLWMLGSHHHATVWQVWGHSISGGSARSANITVQIRRSRPAIWPETFQTRAEHPLAPFPHYFPSVLPSLHPFPNSLLSRVLGLGTWSCW